MPGILDAFSDGPTLPEVLPPEPFTILDAWLGEAVARSDSPNPNAMTLATVGIDGRPSARIVLCKGIETREGALVFFTNYESRKGRELARDPRAACVFHWDAQARQARVEGTVSRVSEAESDAYFATRAWESRLGAWASRQSEPLVSREAMLERVAEAIERLGLDLGALAADPASVVIPRPAHWGGFRLRASAVELWVGGTGRVHDRARWERDAGAWRSTRLQP